MYADNVTATTYLAVLSAFFPPGEDFFVRSVNRFRDRVTDPHLRAEVARFTGQEVIHSREHEWLNEVFSERGFRLGVPDRAIRGALAALSLLPASTQLAATAFMEHFTALYAEETLVYEGADGDIHSDLRELWLWHALEELEHMSVSFEVYELDRRFQILAVRPSATVIKPHQDPWSAELPRRIRTGPAPEQA